MNTMNFMVWILPVIFMLHDFEEIIMAEIWSRRYENRIDSVWPKWKPFDLKYIRYYQTPTFAIGVGAEFLLSSLISFFSSAIQGYFVWYGAFLGLILHFVIIHVLLCIRFKGYVPGVITSSVFLLPGIWTLYEANKILHYGPWTMLLACLLGIVLTFVLFQVLHKLMGPWSGQMQKYSEVQIDKQD